MNMMTDLLGSVGRSLTVHLGILFEVVFDAFRPTELNPVDSIDGGGLGAVGRGG